MQHLQGEGWRGTLAQEGVVLPRDCFSSCMYSSSRSSGLFIPCTGSPHTFCRAGQIHLS